MSQQWQTFADSKNKENLISKRKDVAKKTQWKRMTRIRTRLSSLAAAQAKKNVSTVALHVSSSTQPLLALKNGNRVRKESRRGKQLKRNLSSAAAAVRAYRFSGLTAFSSCLRDWRRFDEEINLISAQPTWKGECLTGNLKSSFTRIRDERVKKNGKKNDKASKRARYIATDTVGYRTRSGKFHRNGRNDSSERRRGKKNQRGAEQVQKKPLLYKKVAVDNTEFASRTHL